MLLLAYALFVAGVVWAYRRGGPPAAATRLYAVAVGAGAAVLGAALAYDAVAEGHRASELGLLWALAVGGATLVLGAGRWSGSAALRLREAGFALVAASLVLPSTLTLALPLVAPVVLSLGAVRRAR